jgi:hypothetical protein
MKSRVFSGMICAKGSVRNGLKCFIDKSEVP